MTNRATLALAVALVVMWGVTEAAGGSTRMDVLYHFGARRPALFFSEDPWRLFSSIFLHYGALHLGCNLLGLVTLGTALERACGPAALLYAFFMSGLAGGLASLYFAPQASSVGASGAVFGLAAVMLVLLVRHPQALAAYSRLGTGVGLTLMLAVGLMPQVMGLQVDVSNHLGGFFGGLLSALALRPRLDWRWALPLAGAELGLLAWLTRGPHSPF